MNKELGSWRYRSNCERSVGVDCERSVGVDCEIKERNTMKDSHMSRIGGQK